MKVGIAIFLLDKIDFKPKMVTRDKEGYYITKRGSIYQKGITIIDMYTPNIWTPKYIKQILIDLEREIDNNTIIVGHFSTSLSAIDRISRQNKWINVGIEPCFRVSGI